MLKAFVPAAFAGLVFASSSHAAALTYVLSLNDNGTGTTTFGSYAVYAYASLGDNSGIASFNFTLSGQTTTVNRSPRATFEDTDADGDGNVGDALYSGYTLLRATGSSGVATTGAFDTVSGNGRLVYGVGQTGPGNVRDVPLPPGYAVSGGTVAQGAYGVTNSFITFGNNGVITPTGGSIPVLLATGTFASNGNKPTITTGLAAVFDPAQNGTGFIPTITAVTRDLGPLTPPPQLVTLTVSDNVGDSSFGSGLNWSNSASPSLAGAYVVGGGLTLRTAAGGGNATFGGRSLTIGDNGASPATLFLGNAPGSTVAVDYLTLNKGRVVNGPSVSTATLAGNGITLGAGGGTFHTGTATRNLTVSSFITGPGSLTIAGGGTVTLNGINTYTGSTTVEAGTLRSSSSNTPSMLNYTSGIDLATGAKLELAYTGTGPAAAVRSILTAGYGQAIKFGTGKIRSPGLAAGRTIGYGDAGGVVTVRVTLPGDADLDGDVDFSDFGLLQSGFGQTNKSFAQGDFDYSNAVDFSDFSLLQANFGSSLTGAKAAYSREQYAAVMNITDASQVPEPASIAGLALSAAGVLRRRRFVG